MKNKKSFFFKIVDKFRFKRLKRYEQFGITFAITYLITIFFTVMIVLNYCQDMMVETGSIESVWSFISSTKYGFTFGYCTELDGWTYLIAKIVETLIPTTLTFSGTIWILQTTQEKSTSVNAFLFISLCAFTLAGSFFMVSRLQSMLKFYMWLLFVLFCIVFFFSAKLFNMQNSTSNLHKNEELDGSITG